MEFSDPKEEVLEVVLTPYGRYKLGLGTFQAAHYAFFDDDILYDAAWAPGSSQVSGAQNAIEGRIQEETPSIKSPTAFTGVNSLVNYHNSVIQGKIFSKYGTYDPPFAIQDPVNGLQMIYDTEATQIYGDKFDFLSNPLGTSDLGNDKYPSWALTMLKGAITSSANYLETQRRKIDPSAPADSGVKYDPIPQMNIDLLYNVYVDKLEDTTLIQNSQYVDYNNITFPVPDTVNPYDVVGEIPPNQFENAASEIFADNTFYGLENGKIIIDLLEQNTPFQKENFEIQVFIAGAAFNDAFGNPMPLRFAEPGTELYTDDDVEKYLFITADTDIGTLDFKKPPFATLTTFQTEDELSQVVSTRDFIVRDLYAPDPDEELC